MPLLPCAPVVQLVIQQRLTHVRVEIENVFARLAAGVGIDELVTVIAIAVGHQFLIGVEGLCLAGVTLARVHLWIAAH